MSTSPKILWGTGVTQELTAGHQLAMTLGNPGPGQHLCHEAGSGELSQEKGKH